MNMRRGKNFGLGLKDMMVLREYLGTFMSRRVERSVRAWLTRVVVITSSYAHRRIVEFSSNSDRS